VSAADRIEAAAVAAALVRAELEHDGEARATVLDGADHQAVAKELARVMTAVLRTIHRSDHFAGQVVDIWQEEIRNDLASLAEE
jgi:hypothetical protein